MSDRSSDQVRSEITRRVVLRGAAVGGIALPFLAACGGDGSTPSAGDDAASSPTADSTSGAGGNDAGALASTSDVPVGGGEILKDEQIVLTQPTEGDFKAFTAVCTHMQCIVAEISDGTIHCPCHGSMYSIKDGSVTGGPAPKPLAEIPIKVKGDEITKV